GGEVDRVAAVLEPDGAAALDQGVLGVAFARRSARPTGGEREVEGVGKVVGPGRRVGGRSVLRPGPGAGGHVIDEGVADVPLDGRRTPDRGGPGRLGLDRRDLGRLAVRILDRGHLVERVEVEVAPYGP